MFTVKTPFRFNLSPKARLAVGDAIAAVAGAAFREVVLAGEGFELAHLQFGFRGLTLALSSSVSAAGDVEIEADLGDPARPASLATEAAYRRALEAARRRDEEARRQGARQRRNLR